MAAPVSSTLQSLITLNEQINLEAVARPDVLKAYICLSKVARHCIKQSMESISHGSLSLKQAERCICFPEYNPQDLTQKINQEIHKAHRIFHLAIGNVIASFSQIRYGEEALKNLWAHIEAQYPNGYIVPIYESLPREIQGLVAGAMFSRYKNPTDLPENMNNLIGWAYSLFIIFPARDHQLVHPESPLRWAVKELLSLYPPK